MIEIKNVEKKYDDKLVLDNINLTLCKNSKVSVIMGKSGSGKTTLLRIIMGLLKADSGYVDGTKNKTFSVVFQEDRLVDELSAVKNILLASKKTTSREEIVGILLKIGFLKEDLLKPVVSLSGGMARRVSICRAILAKSDIVIMDEPFKGLDDDTRLLTINFIQENLGKRELILVTHNESDAEIFKTEPIYI